MTSSERRTFLTEEFTCPHCKWHGIKDNLIWENYFISCDDMYEGGSFYLYADCPSCKKKEICKMFVEY